MAAWNRVPALRFDEHERTVRRDFWTALKQFAGRLPFLERCARSMAYRTAKSGTLAQTTCPSLDQASFARSWAGEEVDTAWMTRGLAMSLDKIRALAHVALVHTYRSSDDKRSSLLTWPVLHLQEAYCQT